jgi:hypothetical protein
VLGYTREDFTAREQRDDLMLDALGEKKSAAGLRHCDRVLASGGRRLSGVDGRPKLLVEDLGLRGELELGGAIRPVPESPGSARSSRAAGCVLAPRVPHTCVDASGCIRSAPASE